MAIKLFAEHQKPRNELSLIVHAKCEEGGAWHVDSLEKAYEIATNWLLEGYDPNYQFKGGKVERVSWLPKPPAMPLAKRAVQWVEIHVRLVLVRYPGFWKRLRRRLGGDTRGRIERQSILASEDLYLTLTPEDLARLQKDFCAAREKLRDIGRMRALLAEYLQGEWAGPWDDVVQDGLAEIDRIVKSCLEDDLGDGGKEA